MVMPLPTTLLALKGRFPFRLGATSYILPDTIIPNVRFLGPLLDEIELVLFESDREENLPAPGEIDALKDLAVEHQLTYNIHLPTDILLGHYGEEIREAACRTIMRFYERTRSLDPTMYCLHLEKNSPPEMTPGQLGEWLTNLLYSLEYLLAAGMPHALLAVENIDYPLRWIYPLIRDLNLPLCLDIGHLLRQGENLATCLELYGDRTIMVHLHGVEEGRDHRSLAGITAGDWQVIASFLNGFRGSVSLEVFSLDDLSRSLTRMEELL